MNATRLVQNASSRSGKLTYSPSILETSRFLEGKKSLGALVLFPSRVKMTPISLKKDCKENDEIGLSFHRLLSVCSTVKVGAPHPISTGGYKND